MASGSGGRSTLRSCKSSNSSWILVSVSVSNAPACLILCSGFVYFASWTYFTSTYFPWLPNAGRCAGEEFAAFAGIAILTSYLFLFILFYIATYKKPVPKGRGRAKSALVEMKDEKVPTVGAVRRRLSGASQSLANGYSSPAAAAIPNGRVTRSRKA